MTETKEIKVDDVVAKYISLRNKKSAIEAEAKEAARVVTEKMGRLEAWLMEKADRDGVTSFKTPHGTAFLTTTELATVEDWDAVLGFVKSANAYDLLERRVSKTAVRGYIDAGTMPPGVKFGSRLGVSVRKPGAKE